MKFAIVRSFACSLTFACALVFAASGANAQNWFGQQRNTDEASDLTVRIQKLEAQIRDLTGQNEELQHQNNLLQQQLSARGGGAPQGAPSAPRAQGGPYPAPAGGPMASPGMTQGSMTNPPLAGAPQGAEQRLERGGCRNYVWIWCWLWLWSGTCDKAQRAACTESRGPNTHR